MAPRTPHAGEMEVVTPMTTMDVTCPPGCKEGDQVRIQSPAGQVIQVAVPPGVSAGQVFQAQVPAVQQLHQGMPVVQPMVVAQPMAVAQPIAPIAAVPAGVVASAPVEPIDYSSTCVEKKRREPREAGLLSKKTRSIIKRATKKADPESTSGDI